jgi:prepilin-type N-terminal cleavage/methylation domain-containing protein
MKLAPSSHAGFRRRDWAFTLLEIMVAITIFSGVMVAIYSSWLTIVRSSKRR